MLSITAVEEAGESVRVHYLSAAIWFFFLWNLSRIFNGGATLLNNSIDKGRRQRMGSAMACVNLWLKTLPVIASLPPALPLLLTPPPPLPLRFSLSLPSLYFFSFSSSQWAPWSIVRAFRRAHLNTFLSRPQYFRSLLSPPPPPPPFFLNNQKKKRKKKKSEIKLSFIRKVSVCLFAAAGLARRPWRYI